MAYNRENSFENAYKPKTIFIFYDITSSDISKVFTKIQNEPKFKKKNLKKEWKNCLQTHLGMVFL